LNWTPEAEQLRLRLHCAAQWLPEEAWPAVDDASLLGNVKDLDNIPRLLIAGNPSLKAFASAVTQIQEADPVR
ncbi:hypothetical protein FK513_30690, partial [Klebsiella pneumoniae]|nr:hypothetical protein [Klebsiella pneumoniae]